MRIAYSVIIAVLLGHINYTEALRVVDMDPEEVPRTSE